jgi:hypothetical protein
MRLGNAARAVEELGAAVKLRDEVSDGHYQLGRALTLAGRKEEGRRELERARLLKDRKRESEAPNSKQ